MNSKAITLKLGLLVTLLVTVIISTILSCKKREFLQSAPPSTKTSLEKEWVTVSDPRSLDTAKWNTYLALALPKRLQAKTMTDGGDLGGLTITACEIPDDLQAFAGSPEIVRDVI